MTSVQFRLAERGSATVVFNRPRGPRAVRELAALPGVEAAEGYRTVPVTLRAAQRSYRTAVQGIATDARLRLLLDADLQPISPAGPGIFLTRQLGERLRVMQGDTVLVEVREGERPRRWLTVSGLVDDLVGLSAYMDVAELHRLMGEGETVDAAALLVAEGDAAEVYARLEQLGAVSTVAVKRAWLEVFRGTTARFVLFFTAVLTVFAVVIAIGVVYNAARIALQERSAELATLRVLGFTRGEVSTLLLAELAINTLVAVPLGLVLGWAAALGLSTLHETELFRIPVVIEPRTYAYAVLVVLLSGVATAFLVRRRVDRLDLVSVLKAGESVRSLRRSLVALIGLVGIASVVARLWPRRVPVDVAPVDMGRFELAVEEDGKTRVRERYAVSAPLQGRLLRIELDVGDPVSRGDLLAAIVPTAPPLLDARSRMELRERVAAAEAGRDRADASLARAQVALREARADLERATRLADEGVLAEKELERTQFAADAREKEVAAAAFEREVAVHELEMARAALSQLREDPLARAAEPWEIRSPVAGRVLRVLNESEGFVSAGTSLLELGDAQDLEVVVDLLTSDAAQVSPGAGVRIDGWGGPVLDGRVRLVEPGAFTKVSALGVEEQRVNVLVDITSPPELWASLGDGYRVDARITLLDRERELLVPAAALFRDAGRWAVYGVDDGRARKRFVTLGPRSERAAVVVEGLQRGDRVIVYPGDGIEDGRRVRERAA